MTVPIPPKEFMRLIMEALPGTDPVNPRMDKLNELMTEMDVPQAGKDMAIPPAYLGILQDPRTNPNAPDSGLSLGESGEYNLVQPPMPPQGQIQQEQEGLPKPFDTYVQPMQYSSEIEALLNQLKQEQGGWDTQVQEGNGLPNGFPDFPSDPTINSGVAEELDPRTGLPIGNMTTIEKLRQRDLQRRYGR